MSTSTPSRMLAPLAAAVLFLGGCSAPDPTPSSSASTWPGGSSAVVPGSETPADPEGSPAPGETSDTQDHGSGSKKAAPVHELPEAGEQESMEGTMVSLDKKGLILARSGNGMQLLFVVPPKVQVSPKGTRVADLKAGSQLKLDFHYTGTRMEVETITLLAPPAGPGASSPAPTPLPPGHP